MVTGRQVRASLLALAVCSLAGAASAATDPAWPDGAALATTLQAPAAALRPAAPAEPPASEVDSKFVASTVAPPVLGEPQAIMDRALAEVTDHGHLRAAARQVEHPDSAWTTAAEDDSLWDDLLSMSGEDRFRRLRPVADFLRETAPSELTGSDPVRLPDTALAPAPSRDGWLVRLLKELTTSSGSGHLVTKERVIIALFGIAALSGLFRLAVRS